MSRFAYAGILVVTVALLSFIVATIAGSFVFSGEAAQGAGLHWFFSLPAMIAFAATIGFLSFPWYQAKVTLRAQLFAYLVCAIGAAAAGLVVTELGMRLYMRIAA
jgi:hypothetical protein